MDVDGSIAADHVIVRFTDWGRGQESLEEMINDDHTDLLRSIAMFRNVMIARLHGGSLTLVHNPKPTTFELRVPLKHSATEA